MARTKSWNDIDEQRNRIMRNLGYGSTRGQKVSDITSRYYRNALNGLGYKYYTADAVVNESYKSGKGWRSRQTVKPIVTQAKNATQAKENLLGDRFTWQNGEHLVDGTIREGRPDGTVRFLGGGLSNADTNTPMARSLYTGVSDAEVNRRVASRRPKVVPTQTTKLSNNSFNNIRVNTVSSKATANGGKG